MAIDAITLTSTAGLGPLTVGDGVELANHLEQARDYIRPWVGASFVSTDVEGAIATLTRYADPQLPGGSRIFGIRVGANLVGGAMFTALNPNTIGGGIAEIGCWLEPDAAGAGLATLACKTLLSWAFDTFGMHRVEWHCRADNTNSIALAQRLGFHLEGTLRQSWLFDGRYYDAHMWAMLAEDHTSGRQGVVLEEGTSRPDMQDLVKEHFDEMHAVAGDGDSNALGIEALADPDITLYGLRVRGELLGCVVLKQLDSDTGEVKTLRTVASARRAGIGGTLLDHLIEVGRARGYHQICLETHPEDHFQAARALYRSRGFEQCGPFGDYQSGVRSYFMSLQL